MVKEGTAADGDDGGRVRQRLHERGLVVLGQLHKAVHGDDVAPSLAPVARLLLGGIGVVAVVVNPAVLVDVLDNVCKVSAIAACRGWEARGSSTWPGGAAGMR